MGGNALDQRACLSIVRVAPQEVLGRGRQLATSTVPGQSCEVRLLTHGKVMIGQKGRVASHVLRIVRGDVVLVVVDRVVDGLLYRVCAAVRTGGL